MIYGQFRGFSLGHVISQNLNRRSGDERPWERAEERPPDAGRRRGEGSRAATRRPAAAPNGLARPRLPRDWLLAAAGEGSEHSTRRRLRARPLREGGEAGPPAHHRGEEASVEPPPHHVEQAKVGRPSSAAGPRKLSSLSLWESRDY